MIKIKEITWERIILVVLLLLFFWLWWSKKDDEPVDYSGYIKEFTGLQTQVDSSYGRIDRLDNEFDLISKRLIQRHENIDTISGSIGARNDRDDFLHRSGFNQN